MIERREVLRRETKRLGGCGPSVIRSAVLAVALVFAVIRATSHAGLYRSVVGDDALEVAPERLRLVVEIYASAGAELGGISDEDLFRRVQAYLVKDAGAVPVASSEGTASLAAEPELIAAFAVAAAGRDACVDAPRLYLKEFGIPIRLRAGEGVRVQAGEVVSWQAGSWVALTPNKPVPTEFCWQRAQRDLVEGLVKQFVTDLRRRAGGKTSPIKILPGQLAAGRTRRIGSKEILRNLPELALSLSSDSNAAPSLKADIRGTIEEAGLRVRESSSRKLPVLEIDATAARAAPGYCVALSQVSLVEPVLLERNRGTNAQDTPVRATTWGDEVSNFPLVVLEDPSEGELCWEKVRDDIRGRVETFVQDYRDVNRDAVDASLDQ